MVDLMLFRREKHLGHVLPGQRNCILSGKCCYINIYLHFFQRKKYYRNNKIFVLTEQNLQIDNKYPKICAL